MKVTSVEYKDIDIKTITYRLHMDSNQYIDVKFEESWWVSPSYGTLDVDSFSIFHENLLKTNCGKYTVKAEKVNVYEKLKEEIKTVKVEVTKTVEIKRKFLFFKEKYVRYSAQEIECD